MDSLRHDIPRDWKQFYKGYSTRLKYSKETAIKQTQKLYGVTREQILNYEEEINYTFDYYSSTVISTLLDFHYAKRDSTKY